MVPSCDFVRGINFENVDKIWSYKKTINLTTFSAENNTKICVVGEEKVNELKLLFGNLTCIPFIILLLKKVKIKEVCKVIILGKVGGSHMVKRTPLIFGIKITVCYQGHSVNTSKSLFVRFYLQKSFIPHNENVLF